MEKGVRIVTPRYIWNIDGTHNKSGSIKEYVDLQVQVGPKKEEMRFLVTHIGEDELALGYPWLAAFQPKIDWKNAVLDEKQQPLVIKTLGLREDKEAARICKAWTRAAQERAEEGEEIFICKMLRSRPTCHGIRRTVIDTARGSLVFHFFCIILRLDPCRTGPLPPH